jgi:hypothetical protein
MEADRHLDYISHIEKPQKPLWYMGSSEKILAAISEYMKLKAPFKYKNGTIKLRKRRKDHRCLCAGTLSWPDPCSANYISAERNTMRNEWFKKTILWLKKKYGEMLIGICIHKDESHPHLHFFLVGDAQRIHPGLRAELIDDQRIVDSKARIEAHRAGLTAWLDEYYQDVGESFGMIRKTNARPAWRIKDRQVRQRLMEIDELLLALSDTHDLKNLRNELWDSAAKTHRSVMRF